MLINSQSQSQPPSSQPPGSQAASCSGACTFNDKGIPVTVPDCQPTASSSLAARDAAIQRTTLMATPRISPEVDRFELKERWIGRPKIVSAADHPSSGGSKTTARWVAGLGTLLSALIMTALLA